MKLNDMLVDISECNEGSDVCEFYIESKLLANIVGRLIDATELDFDDESGRWLSVKNNVVHGIACIDEDAPKFDDLIRVLDEAIYIILHSEEDDDLEEYWERTNEEELYYEELEESKDRIYKDVVSVKWESVCTDLSAMDFSANIDCIDEAIFIQIMEQRIEEEKKTYDTLEEALNDSSFISDTTEYLYAEEHNLVKASYLLYREGKEEYCFEIKVK